MRGPRPTTLLRLSRVVDRSEQRRVPTCLWPSACGGDLVPGASSPLLTGPAAAAAAQPLTRSTEGRCPRAVRGRGSVPQRLGGAAPAAGQRPCPLLPQSSAPAPGGVTAAGGRRKLVGCREQAERGAGRGVQADTPAGVLGQRHCPLHVLGELGSAQARHSGRGGGGGRRRGGPGAAPGTRDLPFSARWELGHLVTWPQSQEASGPWPIGCLVPLPPPLPRGPPSRAGPQDVTEVIPSPGVCVSGGVRGQPWGREGPRPRRECSDTPHWGALPSALERSVRPSFPHAPVSRERGSGVRAARARGDMRALCQAPEGHSRPPPLLLGCRLPGAATLLFPSAARTQVPVVQRPVYTSCHAHSASAFDTQLPSCCRRSETDPLPAPPPATMSLSLHTFL